MRLRKLTRAKKARRPQRLTFATIAKQFARAKKGHAPALEAGVMVITAAVICVAVGAMLSAALHTGTPAETSIAKASAKSTPAPVTAASTPWAPDDVIAEKSAPSVPAVQTAVTITGCLEQDDDTFRLKNTSGAEAPKSRSWKSGFLKKNSSSIEVIDTSNRVQLPSHVGQRVVVTGLLVDREMQVRSLRSVATTCNQAA